MHASWGDTRAATPAFRHAGIRHVLVVAWTAVTVVLAMVLLWFVVGVVVWDGPPATPSGPIPGPGLDL